MFRVCNSCGAFDITDSHACNGGLIQTPSPKDELIKELVAALETYNKEKLYTLDGDEWIKPGKAGWDDPPSYSEFHINAADLIKKARDMGY